MIANIVEQMYKIYDLLRELQILLHCIQYSVLAVILFAGSALCSSLYNQCSLQHYSLYYCALYSVQYIHSVSLYSFYSTLCNILLVVYAVLSADSVLCSSLCSTMHILFLYTFCSTLYNTLLVLCSTLCKRCSLQFILQLNAAQYNSIWLNIGQCSSILLNKAQDSLIQFNKTARISLMFIDSAFVFH